MMTWKKGSQPKHMLRAMSLIFWRNTSLSSKILNSFVVPVLLAAADFRRGTDQHDFAALTAERRPTRPACQATVDT